MRHSEPESVISHCLVSSIIIVITVEIVCGNRAFKATAFSPVTFSIATGLVKGGSIANDAFSIRIVIS